MAKKKNDLPFDDDKPKGAHLFKKGNTLQKDFADPSKIGRPKALKSPEELFKYFELYCLEVDENPWLKHDFKGKDATPVNIKMQLPYTWFGFDNWLFKNEIISDLDDYKQNKGKKYKEFSGIITRIDKIIYDRKINGASVGAFNASIIARELKLVDSSDITSKGKKIGSTPSKIEVEIIQAKDEDE